MYGPQAQPPGYGPAGYPPVPGPPPTAPPAQPPPWWTQQQPPQQFQPGEYPRRRGRAGLILSLVTVLVAAGIGVGLYFALRGNDSGGGGLADTDTVDPCSLVAADELKYLNADVQIQPSDFDSCSIIVAPHGVTASNNSYVEASVNVGHGFQAGKITATLGANATTSTQGPLHIVKQSAAAGSTSCEEAAFQDDGSGVTITSTSESGTSSTPANIDLCLLSDRLTSGVVDTVTQHKVVHLSYPKDSVGAMTLCLSLGAADAVAALPIPGMTPQPSSNRHACAWATDIGANSPGIVIYTKLNTTQGWANERRYGSSTTTIAGRETVITKSDSTDTDLFCIATVAIKRWNQWPGRMVFGGDAVLSLPSGDDRTSPGAPGLVEEVNIGVTPATNSGTTDQACQAMQDIAAKLWPQLPPSGN
jgi:hypothetical protein